MGVSFIGYIGFNNHSEIHHNEFGCPLDRDYVERAAMAQEAGGFDRASSCPSGPRHRRARSWPDMPPRSPRSSVS